MVLYVYTSIYTFTKKKGKKNILIYIPYYIIKDMGHLLLIYIFVKCIILKIFYYRMDTEFSLKKR